MTQYTTYYNIPMPDNGDPIYKGAQQMRDLATKIDSQMHTVSGASAVDATSLAQANKIIKRDGSARARVAAPAHNDDIVNLGTMSSRLGGLTLQVRTSPPPAGTSDSIITFVK